MKLSSPRKDNVDQRAIVERIPVRPAHQPRDDDYTHQLILEIVLGLTAAIGMCMFLLWLNSLLPKGW